MKLIYKAKWIIVAMSAIAWIIALGTLFVGESASINRLLLGVNLLFFIMQTLNVFISFKNKQKNTGIALLICLIVYLALLWIIYIESWNYTVKAMTIGFE